MIKSKKLFFLEEIDNDRFYCYIEKKPNIKCIEAIIAVNNIQSSNLVKKFDFEYMGLSKFYFKNGDEYLDAEIYDLVI